MLFHEQVVEMVIYELIILSIFDNDEFHVEQQYPDENDEAF